MTKTARLTYIRTTNPTIIGKYIKADGTTGLEMDYVSGDFGVVGVDSVADLARFIDVLEPGADYLTFSVPTSGIESGTITTRARERKARTVIAKTKQNFTFPTGPGVLMIDCDLAGVTGEDLHSRLGRAAPDLAFADMAFIPSSSSYLFRGNEQLSGLKGGHGYFLIKDASDIPRAGQALFDRLWLAGFGYVKADRAGRALLRAPYDRAMRTPVQPCFAAGMFTESPYRQNRGRAEVIHGLDGVVFVDTRAAIPDLTDAERRKVRKLQQKAIDAAKPELDKIQTAFLAEQDAAIDADPCIPASDKAHQKAALRRMLKSAKKEPLPLGWIIRFKDLPDATVAEILMNPRKYDGLRCFDPVSDYYSGYLHVDRSPVIHSCASGGVTYPLGSPDDRRALHARRNTVAALLLARKAGDADGIARILKTAPEDIQIDYRRSFDDAG